MSTVGSPYSKRHTKPITRSTSAPKKRLIAQTERRHPIHDQSRLDLHNRTAQKTQTKQAANNETPGIVRDKIKNDPIIKVVAVATTRFNMEIKSRMVRAVWSLMPNRRANASLCRPKLHPESPGYPKALSLPGYPEGITENSPMLQLWVRR